MGKLTDELQELATRLREEKAKGDSAEFQEPLAKLEDVASAVAKAWSGSSLGYHSRVYYADLQPPPPGAHFSQEWAFLGQFQGTTGDWREYDYDSVRDLILERAGAPDLRPIEKAADHARNVVNECKAAAVSVIGAATRQEPDGYLAKLKEEVDGIAPLTVRRATELQIRSGQVMSRDTTALGQGFMAAPHQEVIGMVVGCRSPFSACEELAVLCTRAADHLERVELVHRRRETVTGSKVFIGHGRSLLWRELKDFVQDRLNLKWDEFNRVPVAGVTNVERLVQMLDDAAIALLVLTAEDERVDGVVTARANVIHEAGLFQGRLGFSRAIVLLEEGCDEFTNIAGLGQIRFPPGKISAVFEEVRRVLEREELV